MEAVADLPAFDQHSEPKPFINSSNARELAQKRWQMQREKEANPSNAVADAMPDAETPIQKDDARAEEIARLKRQIEHLDGLIESATDAKDLQMLTNARWKQFETWRILSGIPMPGSRKPAADKPSRQRGTFAEPT